MKTALMKAIELILNGSLELNNILSVTARMSLSSSIIALLIGEYGDSILNSILTLLGDRLHGAYTLLLEGNHDLQRL